jgi:hypothetical protein
MARKLSKSERTMDVYMKAGAEMRIFKTLATKTYAAAECILTEKDRRCFSKVMDIINELCSTVDASMFDDFPQIGHDYTKVFYGASDNPPINHVDEQIHIRMKETLESLLPKLPEE